MTRRIVVVAVALCLALAVVTPTGMSPVLASTSAVQCAVPSAGSSPLFEHPSKYGIRRCRDGAPTFSDWMHSAGFDRAQSTGCCSCAAEGPPEFDSGGSVVGSDRTGADRYSGR